MVGEWRGDAGGNRAVRVKGVTREGQYVSRAAARVGAMCTAARAVSSTPSSSTVILSGASGQGASFPDGTHEGHWKVGGGAASSPGTHQGRCKDDKGASPPDGTHYSHCEDSGGVASTHEGTSHPRSIPFPPPQVRQGTRPLAGERRQPGTAVAGSDQDPHACRLHAPGAAGPERPSR